MNQSAQAPVIGGSVPAWVDPVTGIGRTAHAVLSAENVARVSASPVLALHEGSIGKLVALSPARSVQKSATAGIISIRGPLGQRAIYDMCGYIDGYDAVVARFQQAHSDTETDVVVVDIDSCGGDVAGLEQAVDKMVETTARSGKPVFVYVNEAAFSAAYWIAAKIASPGGLSLPPAGAVGSIGCIGGLVDESGALEQAGLKITLVRVPDGKAEAHSADPVQPLADQRLRKRVGAAAERFFAAMASARGLSVDEVRAFNADTFQGSEAVKAGLADKVEDFESLVARAQSAGRKWRRSVEQKAMDEKRFQDLEAFESKMFTLFGTKDHASTLGAATAAKQSRDEAPALHARVAGLEQNGEELQKRFDDAEAKRLMDAAQADRKLVPGNRAKAEGFYASHGLKSLTAFLDALVPVAPAAERQASEPKPTFETPAEIAAKAGVGTGGAKFEDMTPKGRADFAMANGRAAYDALKQDWIDRGSPTKSR